MNLAELTRMNEDQIRRYFESLLWPNGPTCPRCKGQDVTKLQGEATRPGVYLCNPCRRQFTVTVGTIFEDSHIPLRSWAIAIAMMCASKKAVSAKQLQRQLGLGSYKSAWFMCHRIRHAMAKGPLADLLDGAVEVDETYVGGKPRKGQRDKAGNIVKHKRGRGTKKTPVVALVERGGNVRTRVVADVTGTSLKDAIRDHVSKQATVYTDEHKGYIGVGGMVKDHKTINHKECYAIGDIHINTGESFFSLLKRGVIGAFHHVSKKHLPRYCCEFEFRWERRKMGDGTRAAQAIQAGKGKRLMYREPSLA